jgi:catalase
VDNQNSMTAGPRGPMLLQDVWFLEKLAHFDREVIPERRMHAKGSGAFGTFTVTHDITATPKPKSFLADRQENRSLSCAFRPWPANAAPPMPSGTSAALPSSSIPKRATGTWSATTRPVFFLRDPLKFPDLNHAVKRDPRTNLRSALNNWDFWTSLPEALHQVTVVMSDRGIPASYRHMHGFGSHTFSFINAKNERFGSSSISAPSRESRTSPMKRPKRWSANAAKATSATCTTASKKAISPAGPCLSRSCRKKRPPNTPSIPFDLTKVWSKKDYPLIEVGVMELNKNPENYFAEVEQAAFNPANVVPGIGFSPDKMLQGGCFPTAMPSATGWASTTT